MSQQMSQQMSSTFPTSFEMHLGALNGNHHSSTTTAADTTPQSTKNMASPRQSFASPPGVTNKQNNKGMKGKMN